MLMENVQIVMPNNINVETTTTAMIVDRKKDKTINCLKFWFCPFDTSKISINPGMIYIAGNAKNVEKTEYPVNVLTK